MVLYLFYSEEKMTSLLVDHSNTSGQLSFLRARDPSILSGNFALRLKNTRTNLLQNIEEDEVKEQEDDKNIQIHLRIKYADSMDQLYKIDDNDIHCSISASSHSNTNMKDVESIVKKFTFTQIFPPNSTQEELFNAIVKPKVFKFINGENSTLMSYGASGSGKTFTIVGTVKEPGIIPRTLEYLFRTLPELSEVPLVRPTQSGEVEILNEASGYEEVLVRSRLLSMALQTIDEGHINTYQEMQSRLSREPVGILDDLNASLAVWVSFSEIYNENIYDLLTPIQRSKANNRPKLKLASFNANTYVKDLTNVSVSSGIEAYQILQYGLHNLKYASTSINPHSSRSHCIFAIKIAQVARGTNYSRLNYFNFCDLAGSERLKKTLNVGDRLKESNNINTSLLVLGRCISCIRENQKKNTNKIIPYRESKLTRLFQRALSGNESISMIVNMNPAVDMFEESLHALNFSAIAKDVVVRRTPIKLKTKNRFSSYLQSKNLFHGNYDQEAKDSEITKLQDIIDKLYLEFERLSRHATEQEWKIRQEVIQEQNAIMDEMRQHYQKRSAEQDNRHRQHIEELRNLYRNTIEESEVINISSSSDEDDSMVENKREDLRQQNNVLLAELTKKNDEIHCLKKNLDDATMSNTQTQQQVDKCQMEMAALKTELSRKEHEIIDLKRFLDDAETACREIQNSFEQQINDLLTENYGLKEENSELAMQVEEYSKMCMERDEIVSSGNEYNELPHDSLI
ncbi:kinesin-A [Trypoxylus dichotomus]